MVYISLLTSILLATTAFAAPSQPQSNRSQPLKLIETAGNISYSENWSGAVWNTYPNGTFTSVSAVFVVPAPGSDTPGSASIWVGIDGNTCTNALLQTGIYITVDENGSASYSGWYEWLPDVAHDFDNFPINEGDVIELTVTATSTTTGIAVIQNLSTYKTVAQSLSSSHALCLQNAEWIVEDYQHNGKLVPFVNFGTVAFGNVYATLASGGLVTADGATIYNILQNGTVLTSVYETSTGLTVKYIGGN